MFSHQYRYPKRNKTQTAEINMAVNRMLENKIHYLDAKASNVDLVRLKILWKVRRASPSFYIRRSPRHPLPDFHEINLFKTTRDSLSEDLSFVKRGFAEENEMGKRLVLHALRVGKFQWLEAISSLPEKCCNKQMAVFPSMQQTNS